MLHVFMHLVGIEARQLDARQLPKPCLGCAAGQQDESSDAALRAPPHERGQCYHVRRREHWQRHIGQRADVLDAVEHDDVASSVQRLIKAPLPFISGQKKEALADQAIPQGVDKAGPVECWEAWDQVLDDYVTRAS